MERCRAILGYEGFYEVSDLGRVRSVDRTIVCKNGALLGVDGCIMKHHISKKGYFKISLAKNGSKKRFSIHQLVSIAFMNHTPCGMDLVVDHIDDDKTNNKLSNLQIMTTKENNVKMWEKRRKKIGRQSRIE